MADAATTRYQLVQPEVGASADTWGAKLNSDLTDLDVLLGVITTGGSADAYTLTTTLSLAALVSGQSFLIKPNFTNAGAATIDVDGLGPKDLRKNGTTALAASDFVSGTIYRIAYDGTVFQVLGALPGVFQPLDADLTAIAALGYTSGDYLIKKTAANTYTLITITAAGENLLDDASASAQRTTLGLGTMATQAASSYLPLAAGSGQALTGDLFISSMRAAITLDETDAGANEKRWEISASAGVFRLATYDDAGGFGQTAFSVARSGTSNVAMTMTTTVDFVLGSAAPTSNLSAGYRRFLAASITTGTPVAADCGKTIYATGSVTQDDGIFSVGDWYCIYAGASARTLTQASGCTQRLDGTATTGNLTLQARGWALVRWISSTECVVSGAVS